MVIYFGNAALQEVCSELCAKHNEPSAESAFTTFPYVGEGWKDELEPSELLQLVEALGGTPTCAVHIAFRRGNCFFWFIHPCLCAAASTDLPDPALLFVKTDRQHRRLFVLISTPIHKCRALYERCVLLRTT